MSSSSPLLRRLAIALTAALLATVVATLPTPPAGAEVTEVTVSPSSVAENHDFATSSFADPWDFSQSTDIELHEDLGYSRMSNVNITNGRFIGTSQPYGSVMLMRSWDPGGIPWGRDGALHPISANSYSHIAFRMKTTLSGPAGGGQVNWYSCGQTRADCRGAAKFTAQPGWHTYIVPLVNDPGWNYPRAWSGQIRGLQLAPSSVPTTIQLDWVRLFTPGTDATVTVADTDPPTAPTVFWDRDKKHSNNTPDNPNWGPVGTTTNGQISFPASAYPPGSYYFFADDGGALSSHSSRLTIDKRPRPVIISPDAEGGRDYAQMARNNQWDFNQPNDVAGYNNAAGTVSGGLLVGTNQPPHRSDNQVFLPVAGTIRGSQWHRLSVRVHYSGGFSLSGGPGGGMNARFVWGLGPGQFRVSDDLVVRPGWNDITIDLAELTPADVEGSGGVDWTGRSIDLFRFDPHEDSGTRQFKIDHIRLREDDRGVGSFDIRFKDMGFQPGTIARIYADNNDQGHNGTLIGVVEVHQGVNTFRWTPSDDLLGRRYIHIAMTDPAGTTSRSYSPGPVQMLADPSNVSPVGNFEKAVDSPGGMYVKGWAYDGDSTEHETVEIYVDGVPVRTATANNVRRDVREKVAAVPVMRSGFNRIIPASPGWHDVCVVAINQHTGSDRHIGCRTVFRNAKPVGQLETIARTGTTVRVRGWAVDPNSADPVNVRVVADGVNIATFAAGDTRNDNPWNGAKYGTDIGFDETVTVSPGPTRVCVWALNVGLGGGNTKLACHDL
ncbi:MAG: hypothetical protein OES57_01945 [Acidimicrobiia bacterium]|nr:hypothetical protein [Acidimicrobiia bacterium]